MDNQNKLTMKSIVLLALFSASPIYGKPFTPTSEATAATATTTTLGTDLKLSMDYSFQS